jgi:hypothetical protein
MLATILLRFLLSKTLKIKIYVIIILLIILYGCETWSFMLREENRLRVCENRVLRTRLGSKREEITGGWRQLYDEELAYSPLNNRRIN